MPAVKNHIQAVKHWVDKTVIGFNFCPFAKREFQNERIHYQVVEAKAVEDQLHALAEAFKRLDDDSAIETSLLILPAGVDDFEDYLDLLELANKLLDSLNYGSVYQLASFHPDYCFQGVSESDPANYTNRSPFPMIHIIREASLEKALASYPDPEAIPDRNIELAREKGAEVFKGILDKALSHD